MFKTYAELVQRVESDIIARFSFKTPSMRVSSTKILARVIAGAVWLLQGLAKWVSQQPFAITADFDNLKQIGFSYNVDIKPATFSTGTVLFEGIEGAVIPQGTIVSRVSDGYSYQTTKDSAINAFLQAGIDVVAIEVEGSQSAGVIGNCDVGTELQITNSVAGVNSQCFASTDFVGGYDEESEDDYRERVLYVRRNPINPGSVSFYKNLATSVVGVTDAYIKSNYPQVSGVTITLANFVNASNPIVDNETVQKVIDVANAEDTVLVTADVHAFSVVLALVSLKISVKPYTNDIASDCNNKIKNLLRREGVPRDTYIQGESSVNEITIARIESELATVPNLQQAVVTEMRQDNEIVDVLKTDYITVLSFNSAIYSELL